MEVLKKDLVAGTFTHRTKYLPRLLDSWREHCSNVPFVVQMENAPILENFMQLREHFRATNKRFWLFTDDDIEFVSGDTLDVALETMIRNRSAMVGCYSTFKRGFVPDQPLPEKEITWMPGYFQLVDSWKVGHVTPNLNLPDHNTSIDTTYSVNILLAGHKIHMAPTFVHHTYKKGSWLDKDAYEKTNEFLAREYGDFYFKNVGGFGNIIGPLPSMEDHRGEAFIEWDSLWDNRNRLIAWQQDHLKNLEPDKLRLHLGCGGVHLDGYVNVDLHDRSVADEAFDVRFVPEKYTGSVQEICCHHVIEHISGKDVHAMFERWFQCLVPGGLLELGTPDLELCAAGLVAEPDRFEYWEDRFYGSRVDEGQFHRGGFSKKSLSGMLVEIGFEIVEMYDYDANGMAPSIFILARRPL